MVSAEAGTCLTVPELDGGGGQRERRVTTQTRREPDRPGQINQPDQGQAQQRQRQVRSGQSGEAVGIASPPYMVLVCLVDR